MTFKKNIHSELMLRNSYVCILPPHTDLCLFVLHGRRSLHHHSIVPVEGARHHAGELSASLHPQVPAQTLLPAQLLQADHLKTDRSLRPRLLPAKKTERRPCLHPAELRPENQTWIHPL